MPPAVLAFGRVDCGECALEFTAAVLRPLEGPPVPAPLEQPSGGASCARHARNAALAACERCGAFMCGLCRVEVDGQSICAACFDRGRNEGSLKAAQTTFRSWRTLGLHLAVVGIFLYPLGMLTGPASLFATARGVAQSRKDGDEGGALGTVVAVLLGLLVTALGALFLLVIGGVLYARKVH
jgi:hypothetical protein